MTFAKSLSAALALSLVAAAPAAAQTRSMNRTDTMDTMSQMQRYCAETAGRTDEAGRAWYAANCSPEMMARHSRPMIGTGGRITGILFGLGVVAAAIFLLD